MDKSAEKPPPVDNGAIAGLSEAASGVTAPALSTTVADATNASENYGATVADETVSAEPTVADETVAAESWLETEGVRIVTERMTVHTSRAVQLIGRWRRDLDGPLVLVDAILGADGVDATGGRFHVLVTDRIDRHLRALANGLPLPLKPVPVGAAMAIRRSEPPPAIEAATDESLPSGMRKQAG